MNLPSDTEGRQTHESSEPPTDAASSLTRLIEHCCEKAINRVLSTRHLTTSRRLFTTTESAHYLMISEARVRELMARKELPKIRIGRRVMVDLCDLERCLPTRTKLAKWEPAVPWLKESRHRQLHFDRRDISDWPSKPSTRGDEDEDEAEDYTHVAGWDRVWYELATRTSR